MAELHYTSNWRCWEPVCYSEPSVFSREERFIRRSEELSIAVEGGDCFLWWQKRNQVKSEMICTPLVRSREVGPHFIHSHPSLISPLMESWVVSSQLISFCLFHIGLIVQDHSDPMFSSYAYKSHYLLNESTRAELMRLPMVPSSSASQKKCEKGNN